MKKFWSIFTVALVALSAVSCSNNFENEATINGVESLSFVVNIDNTRTALEQGENGWNTVWVGDETLVVTSGNNTFNFTNTVENKNKFTCEAVGVRSLVGSPAKVYYNNVINSAAGAAGMSLTGATEAFSETVAIELSAVNAFLKVTSAEDVTLTLSEAAFGDGEKGINSVVVKGENVLVPVGAAQNVTLTASYGELVVKETVLTIENNKIYNLGTLEAAPVVSEYGIVGSFQGWDVANPIKMYSTADGWDVATGIELYKDDELKIVKGTTWNLSFGPSEASVLAVDAEHTLVSANSQNVKIAKNGKFDVYFNATSKKFKYTCTEEYTDLNVTITIDNKANWSPLYIILKDGENLITPAEGALVENNKYTISGEYIGSSLTYQLVSGNKTTDPAFVAISKTGATVTLEENVIKLFFQLETANAKQWWGNTSKIHVWNTNTSFDTTWPGTTMTPEDNYTWSVVVPSELVGRTINFLIHNSNGWQSKDSKVTIKAEGVTVTESSIGIQ